MKLSIKPSRAEVALARSVCLCEWFSGERRHQVASHTPNVEGMSRGDAPFNNVLM
jgi:hypothetical protein